MPTIASVSVIPQMPSKEIYSYRKGENVSNAGLITRNNNLKHADNIKFNTNYRNSITIA